MITPILVISYLAGVVALADGLRRQQSAWVAADRERGFWLMLIAAMTFVALGLVVAIVYAVSVVPAFSREGAVTNSGFEKRR